MSPFAAVAVGIPAHNEAANLPGCLKAVATAAACAPLPVSVVVVLDDSDDDSEDLAGRFAVGVESRHATHTSGLAIPQFRHVSCVRELLPFMDLGHSDLGCG